MSDAPNWSARIDEWLGSWWSGLLLLTLLGGLYTWTYVQHPLNPGSGPVEARLGWWSWADQYKYLQATKALAAGGITKEAYHYPLGYSALGVPFVRWLPAHPYYVPDLLLVLATAAMWWRLARRWLPATVALLVAADYQIPYVPSDLKLLLGSRATGTRLTVLPEAGVTATPRVGDYHWGWRWDWSRARR